MQPKYFLITFSHNWADEMNLYGFKILDEDTKNKAFNHIKEKYSNGGDIQMGSNQESSFSSLNDIMRDYQIKEITLEEKNVLTKFFGTGFGHTGALDDYFWL